MFDRLVHWTLLSGITNSAQNIYLDELVRPTIGFNRVNDRWSLRARTLLEKEKKGLLSRQRKEVGSRRRATQIKLDAINKLLARRTDVNRTLMEASEVIPRIWAEEGDLGKWRDSPSVIELVTEIAHDNGRFKIFDVGYVKGTKWLHNLGVGQQVVPPLAQNAKFLAEFCGCSEFKRLGYQYHYLGGLDETEMPQVIVEWAPVNKRCRELAQKLPLAGADAQLVGDTIHLVMYVRGLFQNDPTGRKISPTSLLTFFKKTGIAVEDFMDDIYNVDEIPRLMDELDAFFP